MKRLSTALFILFIIFTTSATNAQTIDYSLDEGVYYSLEELLLLQTEDYDWSGKFLSIDSDIGFSFSIRIDGLYYGSFYTYFENQPFELPSVEGGLKIFIEKDSYWDGDMNETTIEIVLLNSSDANVGLVLSTHKIKNGLFEILHTNIPMWKKEVYLFPNQELNHYIEIEVNNIPVKQFLTGIDLNIWFDLNILDENSNFYRMDDLDDLFDDIQDDIDDIYLGNMDVHVIDVSITDNRAFLQMTLLAKNLKFLENSKNFYLNIHGLQDDLFIGSRVWIDIEFRTADSERNPSSIHYSWWYGIYENTGINGDINGNNIVDNDDINILVDALHWTSDNYMELRNSVYNGPGDINISRIDGIFDYFVTRWDLDALNMYLNGGNSYSELWGFGLPIGDNTNFVLVDPAQYDVEGTTLQIQNSADFTLVKGRFADGKEYFFEVSAKGSTSIELPEGVVIYDVISKKTNITTAVSKNIEIPKEFSISQNYPNPFNPTTKIDFAISETTEVTLKVFNSLGQEVAELVNSSMEAGNHSVDFDASSLTSGIYFYRIQAGQFVETRKMTLLK